MTTPRWRTPVQRAARRNAPYRWAYQRDTYLAVVRRVLEDEVAAGAGGLKVLASAGSRAPSPPAELRTQGFPTAYAAILRYLSDAAAGRSWHAVREAYSPFAPAARNFT